MCNKMGYRSFCVKSVITQGKLRFPLEDYFSLFNCRKLIEGLYVK